MPVRFLSIILLCIAAAITYGILHDQVTARICVEYFTIGHPKIINSTSPTLLALAWGVIATWWVGLGLGIPPACAARLGRSPRIEPRQLIRPILILLCIMAVASALFGTVGYLAARNDVVSVVGHLAAAVPSDRHNVFLADLWAHNAAYAVGAIGGLFLIGFTAGKRAGLRPASIPSKVPLNS